jgi:hypothetical protein
MSTQEKKSLTLSDPVDPETLEQFLRLQEARQRFADSYLSLEQEKIRILAAVKRIDDQRNRLFETCALERGVSPEARISIDARSGMLSVEDDESPEPLRVPDQPS